MAQPAWHTLLFMALAACHALDLPTSSALSLFGRKNANARQMTAAMPAASGGSSTGSAAFGGETEATEPSWNVFGDEKPGMSIEPTKKTSHRKKNAASPQRTTRCMRKRMTIAAVVARVTTA